jgi:hypothetical protein
MFRSSTDEVFETLGITKLDKEKNQCIREKWEHRTQQRK